MGKSRTQKRWPTAILVFLFVAACRVYIQTPEDLIPDYRGWVGWIDDALVGASCLVLTAIAIASILRGRVSFLSVGVPVLCAAYFLSPFDLIPDTINTIGMLDDMAAVVVALLSVEGAFSSLTGEPQAKRQEISGGDWADVE